MSGPTVAIAGCRPLAAYDADWPLLHAALAARRIDAVYAIWDDPEVEWAAFDVVVIRSTWDYVPRVGGFLAWAARVAASTALLNPLEVIRWNVNKIYLADLAAAGLAVIPTAWVAPGEAWTAPSGEYVVKPAISAGARETARYRPGDDAGATAHVRRLQDRGETVMVQPYQAAVDREGEIALVLIDGAFSHAARKQPLLRRGEGVAADPMNRLALQPARPGPAELALADAVAVELRRRFGQDPLYSRVDLVSGPTGDPLVLEVELIEPALFLPLAPGSANRLAAAVAASIH